MTTEQLSISEARRIAVGAQGFDRPRPKGRVTRAHACAVIHKLGLVQLDFVNVVSPAHYQVLFSRLGPFERSLLDELAYRSREFTEQWAHEASILPMESWPLLRHRMATCRVRPWGFDKFLAENGAYVDRVLAELRERGPLSADELPDPEGVSRRIPGTWVRTVPRAVLEALFARGVLAVVDRRPSLARVFDLAERVIPLEHHRREVGREDGQRELLLRAARANGIGTAADLADYFRMPVGTARPRLAELLAAGLLREVRVEGWRETAYLHPEARAPRRIAASALLSPFDPLVWFRPRTKRLYDFDYRFEVFVPQAKRKWGTYVLPFLHGEALAARVDLKADRPGRRLLVLSARGESGVARDEVAIALAIELRAMASWLGLDTVSVGRRGDLSRALASALRRISTSGSG